MSEIKGRMEIVSFIVGKPPLSLAARWEFGYLQLRMMCEVMAIACLVAHGEIPATKHPRMQKLWRAGEILDALEELHPRFYPDPAEEMLDKDGALDGIRAVKTTSKHLSKQNLLTLYKECGGVLHRGALKDIAPRTTTKQHLLKIVAWHNKFRHLLNRHIIVMSDGKLNYVTMQDQETKRVRLLELTRVSLDGKDKAEARAS